MKLMLAQNTAQQRAAARTEQQAQRRAAENVSQFNGNAFSVLLYYAL